jgi:hypothetical protein
MKRSARFNISQKTQSEARRLKLEMQVLTETAIDERGDLFKKDGLYHVRLYLPDCEEPIEVALHGIVSEEHARAVLDALQ